MIHKNKEIKQSLVSDSENSPNDVIEQDTEKISCRDQRWKGILYMNLYICVLVCTTLGAKFIYQRHPDIMPEQLLMGRSIFACFFVIIIVNKDLKTAATQVPDGKYKFIVLRWFSGMINNVVELFAVKYISLVFTGIIRNLTPIATIILSYFLTGERFKRFDIFFIMISLGAVTVFTVGIGQEQSEKIAVESAKVGSDGLAAADDNKASTAFIITIACLSAVIVPVSSAMGNIIMRQMPGLHNQTLSCYLNPMNFVWFSLVIFTLGKWDETVLFMHRMDALDYLLFGTIGLLSVIYQTLRYLANQYEEPGKLSQYQYTNVFYSIVFDLFIFEKSFSQAQCIGICILIALYCLKFYRVYAGLDA